MKNRIITAAFTVCSIFISCNVDNSLDADGQLVVIQAYLYSGEPVQDIKLMSTLPLGSQEAEAPVINDASVTLMKNDQSFTLVPSEGDSGYYHYQGGDLTVDAGDLFKINVEYFGITAMGETEVPFPPENVVISSNSLYVPTDFDFRTFNFDSTRHMIRINWENEPLALHYVTIENIDSDPEPIITGRRFPGGPGFFISVPNSSNEYILRFRDITHYGNHRIRVFHVNSEYSDLYTSRQQDSRDLNEPMSNIVNGLGIFSAFSFGEVQFTAVKE